MTGRGEAKGCVARKRCAGGMRAVALLWVLLAGALAAGMAGCALFQVEAAFAVSPSGDAPAADATSGAEGSEGEAAGEPDAGAGADGAAPADGDDAAAAQSDEGSSEDGSVPEGDGEGGAADGSQGAGGTAVELDPELAEENLVNPQQLPDSSFIYDTSIADLSDADAYYDGQTVQVIGEAIGDNLRASLGGRQRWITLSSNDDASTIAVIMSAEAASRIDTFGAYNVRGTLVQVRGVFNLVCAQHEGVSDLHAEVVNIVEKGERFEDEFKLESFIPGAVAVVVGLFMMGLFYFLRERRR